VKRISLFALIIVVGACASAMSQEDDMKPWPAAGPGEARYVIRLSAMDDESAHGVELFIGRELEIDCNRHWFGGKFERQVVAGWGYSMYRLTDVAGPAATMMACPGDENRMAFVSVKLDDPFLRYNSKLPIVVYVPDGFAVRYRTWSADGPAEAAAAE
jgi:ecotin